MKERTWIYAQSPTVYEIHCDKCGGSDITWSEFEDHIWCFSCELDVKGDGGIFNGPIPLHLCKMMGISFDKFNFVTKCFERMKCNDKGEITYESEDIPKQCHE